MAVNQNVLIEAVCREYGVTLDELLQHTRGSEARSRARIVLWLMMRELGYTYRQCAEAVSSEICWVIKNVKNNSNFARKSHEILMSLNPQKGDYVGKRQFRRVVKKIPDYKNNRVWEVVCYE